MKTTKIDMSKVNGKNVFEGAVWTKETPKIENIFCHYEQSLALKELGFDEHCLLHIQFSSGKDASTGKKYKNSIWLGNGYDAEINNKKIKYQFPEHCEQRYGILGIPTYYQAFRWFREKYNLNGWVVPYFTLGGKKYSYLIMNNNIENLEDDFEGNIFEEAELECLKKLIEICRELK